MASKSDGLLDQIEADALNDSVPLASALRKCVALGGRSGSAELRDWARRELEGYGGHDELPTYRRVIAIIAIDGQTINALITGQRIGKSALPEFAREHIDEAVEFPQGVAQLEHMVSSSKNGSVKIVLPGMADLVAVMNQSAQYGTAISAMYWIVGTNSLVGILDRTRTNLIALVAEMRAVEPQSQIPSAESASQAVNVVINGGRRNKISVTSAQTSGADSDASASTPDSSASGSQVPAWVHGPWGVLVGVGSIVSGFAGLAVWQGWPPF